MNTENFVVITALFSGFCYLILILWMQEWLAESQLLSTKCWSGCLSLFCLFKCWTYFVQIARQAYLCTSIPACACGLHICTDFQILTWRQRIFRCFVSNKCSEVLPLSPAKHASTYKVNKRSKQRINQRSKLVFIELEAIRRFISKFLIFGFQDWPVFKEVSSLLILVPPLLGLKGNLDTCLASRLSTQANLGKMNSCREVWKMIVGNIAVVQVISDICLVTTWICQLYR